MFTQRMQSDVFDKHHLRMCSLIREQGLSDLLFQIVECRRALCEIVHSLSGAERSVVEDGLRSVRVSQETGDGRVGLLELPELFFFRESVHKI